MSDASADTKTSSATVLQSWGILGAELWPQKDSHVSWEPAQRLINAAQLDAKRGEGVLAKLLKESSSRFSPLGDPLHPSLDFGSHRWLRRSREEAYSDWLAWILERQERTEEILTLFEVKSQSSNEGRATIYREYSIGHESQGRLDLLIELEDRLGESSTLVVEVKTDAEPDMDQLRRYVAWARGRPAPLGVVLLAPNPPEEDDLPEDAWPCSWRRVALVLRGWASRWLRERRGVEAALTLAFCGAVEQNVVGLEVAGLGSLSAKEYVEKWLEADDAEE